MCIQPSRPSTQSRARLQSTTVNHPLADAATNLDSTEQLVHGAAWAGVPRIAGADGQALRVLDLP